MIELQLRAKCEGSDKMAVTSGMFELVPNQKVRLRRRWPQLREWPADDDLSPRPGQRGEPEGPDDEEMLRRRDPQLGLPVGRCESSSRLLASDVL
jgi:hypothetical protein